MIKLGLHAIATEESMFERNIRLARHLDLEVIDFHISGMPRDPASLNRLKKLCVEAGLSIGYLGSGSLAGPIEEKEARLARCKADVDLATFMGAQMLRIFARHKWPDTAEEQEVLWVPMIESFRKLCDYAAKQGGVIALQNHDRSSFAMNADQVLRILSDTDRENFTFIMDTGQWQGSIGAHPRGEFDPDVDIYQYMEQTVPFATCVRAKIYKIDTGRELWLNYPRILKILQGVEFNGNISIVFEGEGRNKCDLQECLRLAVQHMRTLIAEVYRE